MKVNITSSGVKKNVTITTSRPNILTFLPAAKNKVTIAKYRDGRDGSSAYQLWLAGGHEGSPEDYQNWLKADALAQIEQLIDGAPAEYNTLGKLATVVTALKAIIDAGEDNDDIVNTVAELLAVFANYPEGVELFELIASKVKQSDVVNNLNQIVAGKVLDAIQGRILKEQINGLQDALLAQGSFRSLGAVVGSLAHTGTTQTGILAAFELPATGKGIIEFKGVFSFTGTNSISVAKLWINSVNNLTGATQIARLNRASVNLTMLLERPFMLTGDRLRAFPMNETNAIGTTSNNAFENIAHNANAPSYFFVTIDMLHPSDACVLEYASLTFKKASQ